MEWGWERGEPPQDGAHPVSVEELRIVFREPSMCFFDGVPIYIMCGQAASFFPERPFGGWRTASE